METDNRCVRYQGLLWLMTVVVGTLVGLWYANKGAFGSDRFGCCFITSVGIACSMALVLKIIELGPNEKSRTLLTLATIPPAVVGVIIMANWIAGTILVILCAEAGYQLDKETRSSEPART